jgi:hypothetical protein
MRHPVWSGLMLLCVLHTTCAQQPPASIVTIVITDPSGAKVPQAEVTLTEDAGQLHRNETSQTGEARFSLAQGSYDVFAHAPGCLTATKHIDVTDSHAERFALRLQGQRDMDESCDEVTSEPPLIPVIASEPLTETIAEIPLSAGPALQPRIPPPGKRTIVSRFFAR